MTHWNHRIVKYKDGQGFGLHEVYYDDDGRPCAMTQNPIHFAVHPDEGPEGLIKSIELALKDAKEKPVFEEPETWAGDPWIDEILGPDSDDKLVAETEEIIHDIIQGQPSRQA